MLYEGNVVIATQILLLWISGRRVDAHAVAIAMLESNRRLSLSDTKLVRAASEIDVNT